MGQGSLPSAPIIPYGWGRVKGERDGFESIDGVFRVFQDSEKASAKIWIIGYGNPLGKMKLWYYYRME